MYTVKINEVSVDKKGNRTYSVATNAEGKPMTATLSKFDEAVAETARKKAETIGGVTQMYVDSMDEVPAGYRAKQLQYSVQIWKSMPSTPELATELFNG